MDTQDPVFARLLDQVLTAQQTQTPLDIRGGSTKAFYGGVPRGEPLDMRALAGITSHEPTELVVTVRAGTLLSELEAALGEHGQCLPFEPPRFNTPGSDGGTVGGMVAAGLAGPARAAVGRVRDFVLGATMLNGRGELLTFGGQVMKNVAGYDVSRLMAGSMGVLGLLCEVSLKVLPMLAAQTTLEFEQDEAQALDWFNALRAQPLPITASSWHGGRLRLRLAGARAAVRSAAQSLEGVPVDANEAARWWRDIRDHHLAYFGIDAAALAAGECLWRLSVPASAPPLALPGTAFIEWGGAQRWIRTAAPATDVPAAASLAGGHATLFRAADKSTGTFSPLTAPLMRIHRELKRALDPAGIFNRGRLYSEF